MIGRLRVYLHDVCRPHMQLGSLSQSMLRNTGSYIYCLAREDMYVGSLRSGYMVHAQASIPSTLEVSPFGHIDRPLTLSFSFLQPNVFTLSWKFIDAAVLT